MAKAFRKPDRRDVERIIRQEARACRTTYNAVLGVSLRPKAIAARRRAVCRLLAETGCSKRGLALVWGIDPASIARALQAMGSPHAYQYDAATIDRLIWQYGEARARLIATGQDPDTQRDLTTWRNVGRQERAA